MSKEQEQRPRELSLEEVICLAKEVTLRDGIHLPTVMAEVNAQTVVIQLVEFPDTHEGRAQQMFAAGFLLAQSGQMEQLQQVFFISEGWMSMAKEGKLPERPPSQDPNRKEILFISRLKIKSQETQLVVFEMLRDEEGRLTELEELQSAANEETQVESPLLVAFVAGFEAGTEGTVH